MDDLSFNKVSQAIRTSYRDFSITIEEQYRVLFYSVVSPKGEEIFSGCTEHSTKDIFRFYNYLTKLVDDYINCLNNTL